MNGQQILPMCIVCEAAPGEITAFVENPTTGVRLTFRCCFSCLRAAATPDGAEKMTAAANRNSAVLENVGGQS